MNTILCGSGQRNSRLDSKGGARPACRLGPASLALVVYVTLGVVLTSTTSLRAGECDECSGEGQRACCVFPFDACPARCDDGLLEISNPTCQEELGDSACRCDGIIFANGICRKPTDCGGEGARACCVDLVGDPGEVGCDVGLKEFTEPNNCLTELGEDACLCSEVLGAPVYSDGVCKDSPCGGEGERACCLFEVSWGACEPGYHEVGFCEDELNVPPDTSTCPCALGGGMCHRLPSVDEIRRLRLQNHLDDDVALVDATLVGTHNSYNTSADGYPLPQHEASLTTQLNLGARVINFDIHNGVFRVILCHSAFSVCDYVFDRPFVDGLNEIKNWLDSNPGELVVLVFEDFIDYWIPDPVTRSVAVSNIKTVLGDKMYTPELHFGENETDDQTCRYLPIESLTKADILKDGKQIILTTADVDDFGSGGESVCCPGTDDACNGYDYVHEWRDWVWNLRIKAFKANDLGSVVHYTNLLSFVFEDRLISLNGNFEISPREALEVLNQGAAVLGLDFLLFVNRHDGKNGGMIWSWGPGQPDNFQGVQRCAAQGSDGQWNDLNCGISLKYACYNTDTDTWGVSNLLGNWYDGDEKCAALGANWEFAVPLNARDNAALNLLRRSAVHADIWLDFRVEDSDWVGAVFPCQTLDTWECATNWKNGQVPAGVLSAYFGRVDTNEPDSQLDGDRSINELWILGSERDFTFDTGNIGVNTLSLNSVQVHGPGETGNHTINSNLELRAVGGETTVFVGEDPATTLTLNGGISVNSGDLLKAGVGKLVVAGDVSTWSGDITVSGGQFIVTGFLSTDTSVTVEAGGTFEVNTQSQTLDTMQGAGSLILNADLEYGKDGVDSEFSGNISGPGGLTLEGDGTITLSGDNSHTGETSIENGTLLINGSSTSSVIQVRSGATLGGNECAGSTNVFAGTIAPGGEAGLNSYASLQFVDLTLNSTSQFELEIKGTSAGVDYDQVNVVNTLGLGGCNLVIIHAGFFIPETDDQFIIANFDSLISVFSNTFVQDGRTLVNVNSGTFEVTYLAHSIVLSNYCRDDLDDDADGVCNAYDVCDGFDDTADLDGDDIPDGCDDCPTGDDGGVDDDCDGVSNGCDLCLGDDSSGDSDGDGICNLGIFDVVPCPDFPDDLCFGDNTSGDSDGDGVCDNLDACPGFNDALNEDGDATPDDCDLCPAIYDEDCNENGRPDCIDLDCDGNGDADDCELGLFDGYALEMQTNGPLIPNDASLNLANGSFSFEFWAAPSADGVGVRLPIWQGTLSPNEGLYIGFLGDDQFTFDFTDNALNAGPFPDREIWHHWAGTYDAGKKERKLYRDGELIAQDVATADYQGSGDLWLGSSNVGFYRGRLDEVRLWNVVRSEGEIQANRNSLLSGSETGLVGYWRFDEPSGTTVIDSSPNQNDGDFIGAPTRFKTIVGDGDLPDCNLNGTIDSCEPDIDGDGVPDDCDLCTGDDAIGDNDNDGLCDDPEIDKCLGFDDGIDSDGDGSPDGCDVCIGDDSTGDSDDDGICDDTDFCFGDNTTGDSDGDGVCDDADVCPGFDDNNDSDGDGVANACDPCPNDNPDDTDGDGVCESADICPGFDDGFDCDTDGTPDGCDPDPCAVGACCLPNESCAILELHLCIPLGGSWQSPGVCPDACLVLNGACCMPDDSCVDDTAPDDCFPLGGFWAGPDTICPDACVQPTGACCMPDESCVDDVEPDDCFPLGGLWSGPGSLCSQSCGNNDDLDADGVLNEVDNCVDLPNLDQADCDDDGVGDVCAINCTGGTCGGANLSFETGDLSDWIVQNLAQPLDPLTVFAEGKAPTLFPFTPTDGLFALYHGWDGEPPGTISIAQDFAIPADASIVQFDYRAGWEMDAAKFGRTFVVRVEAAGGGATQQTDSILTAAAGTTNFDTGNQVGAVDVSAFAGTTVRLVFVWTVPEAFGGPGAFLLDNIRCRRVGAPCPSIDLDQNGVPDPCDCVLSDAAQADLIGLEVNEKNRFLSFTAGNAGREQAIRVTFDSLPSPFDIWNDAELWVGPSSEVSENGSSVLPIGGFPNFNAATLQCTPFYTDYSALGTVHVFHEGIVPLGSYTIQVVDEICDTGDEANFSDPLALDAAKWGDTLKDFSTDPPGPSDGLNNIVDALGIIQRFASQDGSILKPRADLEPGCIDLTINITDVFSAITGFQGVGYSFEPTADDPCDSTCNNPLP